MESTLSCAPEYRNGDMVFGDVFTNIIKVYGTCQDEACNF